MSGLDDIIELSITDFRSISGNIAIPLDAPIVLIHGPNGSGKTSVLAALELALTGDISSMRRDDARFVQHLVHEGSASARIEITTRTELKENGGTYSIVDGALRGKPYLKGGEGKFFSERCYLAQSMLGRLLEIYQNSDVNDGESALLQFVKDLLGLSQLDALVEGLRAAGHLQRTRNLLPEYRAFETRIQRSDVDVKQLREELAQLEARRSSERENLKGPYRLLFGENEIVGAEPGSELRRVQALSIDADLLEATRRRTELQSIAQSWARLPQDADSQERLKIETDEQAAIAAADAWRNSTGNQLEEVVAKLRRTFPDLPSWSSTSPEIAYETAVRRVDAESNRLKQLLDGDAQSQAREAQIGSLIERDEARGKVIDSQVAGLAQNAGEYATALAALTPHLHTDDCPVCGRNFKEVSKGEPLRVHLQRTITQLTENAGKLSALATEKNETSNRLAQLRRELDIIRSRRLSADARSKAIQAQADVEEHKVALTRLESEVKHGTTLLSNEAALKNRLASFRNRDRLATDLRTTLLRTVTDTRHEPGEDQDFETTLRALQTGVTERISRLEELRAQRDQVLLLLQSIIRVDQRRRTVATEIESADESLTVLKAALQHAEVLRRHARTISETARRSRTAVVRRVFNDSLNKIWRDLFIRLAPTEPFVPAFRIPESNTDSIAALETVHRSGKTGGTPGAMLSAGNLNTAALTLFLALHFSVAGRLPWLVLDDPVQSMDEVHVAQLAALLRTISKTHGTKVIVAVHERPLFEYLRLELSPAFERDRLLTVELRRTQGEKTVAEPTINTYAADAIAA